MNFKILLALSIFVTVSNGYKILFVAPMSGTSHWLYMSSFVKTLVGRGHEVTFLTSNSLKDSNLTNYSEVLIDPPLDLSSMVTQDELIEKFGSRSTFQTLLEMAQFPKKGNSYNLRSDSVQKLINSNELHFDLMIMEDFFTDSFMMFAHKFKTPLITISPFGSTDFVDRQMGLLTPWSIAPHWTLPYSDKMTFSQRWYNTIIGVYDWLLLKFVYNRIEQANAEEFFGHLGAVPSLEDIRRNTSIVLINTHRALSSPRPMMPGQINIGGAHIKPTKPLPVDLQQFLDESKHGVIYFSLGSVVKSSKLPKEKIRAFLDAFRTIKQRVLWKFEDESLSDVPPNVLIRKWMPQNDVLAHKNLILFISHGGLFGTSESLYHGRPMLLIPFFGDQHRNAHRIQSVGYGNFIAFDDITKDTLLKEITEIISDESYSMRAQEASAIFNNNLQHPMDEAMWWIEYVCKFKGAKHLRSHSVNLSWFSYLLLDVFAVTLLGIITVLWIIFKLIKGAIRKVASNKDSKQKRS